MVSVVVLVHNGLEHVRALFRSRGRTVGVETEWIVVDNGSDRPTAEYLRQLPDVRLVRSERNLFFAAGNNLGARHAAGEYLLRLNSDVRVNDPAWLAKLLAVHRRGATAYGVVGRPLRCDGFCLLVDRDLYAPGLDERYAWHWSVTRLQARLLGAGWAVQGVRHFDEITHAGGGSGPLPYGLPGMATTRELAETWFDGLPPVRVIDRIGSDRVPFPPAP
jgi:glycosyltransferase involved in cell wall biosynthesis